MKNALLILEIKKMPFKTHMISWADSEGFTTLCGIDEGCSENFYFSTDTLVSYGDIGKTTCKKCLASFAKMEAKHEKELAELASLEQFTK